MADWKAIIVGDAFKLPSRDINYYRDLLLLFPNILFPPVAVYYLFSPGHDHHVLGLKCALLGTCANVFAKAKKRLLAVCMALCSLMSLRALIVIPGWVPVLALVITSATLWLMNRFWQEGDPGYEMSRGKTMIDLVLGVASLEITVAIFQWLQPPHS